MSFLAIFGFGTSALHAQISQQIDSSAAYQAYVKENSIRDSVLMKMGESGEPLVYFDDVKGGVMVDGLEQPVFANDFESQSTIDAQPVTAPVILLGKYEQGHFYKERNEARFRIVEFPQAHSGLHVGVADAGL